MSRVQNPLPLLSICYNHVATTLLKRCPKTQHEVQKYGRNRELFKNFLAQLPKSVRSEVMQLMFLKITTNGMKLNSRRCYSPYLYSVELLFNSTIETLEFLYSSYRVKEQLSDFFKVIAKEGRKLRVLVLTPWPGQEVESARWNYTNFTRALKVARTLSHLALHYICNEDMLRVVGECCTQLQKLDVSFSREVTDDGVRRLARIVVFTKDAKLARTSERRFRTLSSESASGLRIRGVLPPLSITNPQKTFEKLKFSYSKKSLLCDKLRDLNLEGTSVTFRGILALLGLIPAIESLSMDLEEFFSDLDKAWTTSGNRRSGMKLPQFNLSTVLVEQMTERVFHILKTTCPKLKNLEAFFSEVPISRFVALPELTSLKFTEGFDINGRTPNTASNVLCYLGTRGTLLNSLTITNASTDIDLSPVLIACPALSYLWLQFHAISWGNLEAPSSQLLTRARLERHVTERAVVRLLETCLGLISVDIDKIITTSQDFLLRLSDVNMSPYLETFFISDNNIFRNPDHVAAFLNRKRHIKRIGKINCVVSDIRLDSEVELLSYVSVH